MNDNVIEMSPSQRMHDNSHRSFIADHSMLKEMTKMHTTMSAIDKTFQKTEKKEDQILQRVCCIKINRKWRLKRQILITTTFVFLIVLGIVMVFLGVIIFFSSSKNSLFIKRQIYIIQDLTFKFKFKIMLKIEH